MMHVILRTVKSKGATLNHADAQDIYQQALLEFSHPDTLDRVENDKKLTPYLKSICVHKALDWIRKHKHLTVPDTHCDIRDLDEAVSMKHQTLIQSDAGVLDRKIGDLIRGLTIKEEILVKLCWLNNSSTDEAARLMGLSVNTAASILRRTKDRIKGIINEL